VFGGHILVDNSYQLITWNGAHSTYYRLIGGDASNDILIGDTTGSAQNEIHFHTNATGTPAVVFATNGNVGIGTGATSPPQKLSVAAGHIALDNTYQLISKTGAGGNYYRLIGGDSFNRVILGDTTGSFANEIRFHTTQANALPAAVITTAGNVGIGTLDGTGTTPSNRLYVRDGASQAALPGVDATVGTVIESSADGGTAASLAIVGGRKLDSQNHPGFGRLYLGNYDEWDSTRLEGGAGKLTIYVRNSGAAAAPALTVNSDGNLKVSGNIEAKYQDVAEWVPGSGDLSPGTVVVLNRTRTNEVMPSATAYDTAVAGVVSTKPGLLLGESGENKARIATTGRVKVRVDAGKHAIAIGDLLVTSEKPGVAMFSEPVDLGGVKMHRPGTIIGKALESLPAGEGDILVLLSLQ
jgi:hypothetical protein